MEILNCMSSWKGVVGLRTSTLVMARRDMLRFFFGFFFEMYENLQKESKKIEFHQK